MNISIEFSIVLLILAGFAAIGGGVVLLWQSKRVGWRAVGASAVALGIGVFLVIATTYTASSETSLSSADEAPGPQIVTDVVDDPQPTPPVQGPGSAARLVYELPVRYGSGPSVEPIFRSYSL
jgi:hypothetical protein